MYVYSIHAYIYRYAHNRILNTRRVCGIQRFPFQIIEKKIHKYTERNTKLKFFSTIYIYVYSIIILDSTIFIYLYTTQTLTYITYSIINGFNNAHLYVWIK